MSEDDFYSDWRNLIGLNIIVALLVYTMSPLFGSWLPLVIGVFNVYWVIKHFSKGKIIA